MNAAGGEAADVEALLAKLEKRESPEATMAEIVAAGEAAVPAVLQRAKRADADGTRWMQAMCAECLGRIGSEKAVDALLELGRARLELVSVCYGLEQAKAARAIPVLREISQQELAPVEREALTCTRGALGDASVVPDLIRLLRPSRTPPYRDAAKKALLQLTGKHFDDCVAAAKWYADEHGKQVDVRDDEVAIREVYMEESAVGRNATAFVRAWVIIDDYSVRIGLVAKAKLDHEKYTLRVVAKSGAPDNVRTFMIEGSFQDQRVRVYERVPPKRDLMLISAARRRCLPIAEGAGLRVVADRVRGLERVSFNDDMLLEVFDDRGNLCGRVRFSACPGLMAVSPFETKGGNEATDGPKSGN